MIIALSALTFGLGVIAGRAWTWFGALRIGL